jgi:radical SAM protein with 4Fe4S-binding SPASM domain
LPGRFRIREEIAAAPADCAGCRDFPLCLGGCRGLARFPSRKAGGRDPSCSGRR